MSWSHFGLIECQREINQFSRLQLRSLLLLVVVTVLMECVLVENIPWSLVQDAHTLFIHTLTVRANLGALENRSL